MTNGIQKESFNALTLDTRASMILEFSGDSSFHILGALQGGILTPFAPMDSYTLRKAAQEDIPAIVQACSADLAEAYGSLTSPNPDQLRKSIEWLIANPDGFVMVANSEEKLIGMVGALRHIHHVTGELGAGELFWWVDPEYRTAKGPALSLFRSMERWARESGAKWIHGLAPTKETEQVYRAMGYEQVEIVFQRRF